MRKRWTSIAIAVVAVSALFATGAGFDVDAFDSAELALAAVTRGLGHPPGQPLHALLGWLITRGPWPPLAALAWLSIVPGAIAIAVGLAIDRGGVLDRSIARRALAIGIVCVPATMSGSRDVCSRVEVYALAAMLVMIAFLIASRARSMGARASLAVGSALGLAATTNPVIAAQGMGAVWMTIDRTRAEHDGRRVRGAALAAGVVAAAGVYAYAVFGVDRAENAFVWGDPRDLESLLAVMRADVYRGNVSLSAFAVARNVWFFACDAGHLDGVLFVVLGAVGLAVARTERRIEWIGALAASLVIGLGMIGSNDPFLPSNPDYGGYLLVPIAIASVGALDLTARAAERGERVVTLGLAASIVVVCAFAIPRAFAIGRPVGATRSLATETLRSAPRAAIVVLESDHLLFPALYLQRAEGLRRDVTILGAGWSSDAWAWDFARRHDPALRVPSEHAPDEETLARVIADRPEGRPVIAERLALVGMTAGDTSCPRGVAWSSSEGCDHAPIDRRATARTLRTIARIARDAAPSSWDARLAWLAAWRMSEESIALGCAPLAVAYLDAGLGRDVSRGSLDRPCARSRVALSPTTHDVLSVDRGALSRERARVTSRRASRGW